MSKLAFGPHRRSQAEIASLFTQTPQDPASVRFQGLEPDERWQRLADTR